MDLDKLMKDPQILPIKMYERTVGQGTVTYLIFEKNEKYYFANNWQICIAPQEIFMDPKGDMFCPKRIYDQKSKQFVYLTENPFLNRDDINNKKILAENAVFLKGPVQILHNPDEVTKPYDFEMGR